MDTLTADNNKYFAITSLIMSPATNPRGIAITDRYIPSFKIIFLICFLVVPIALNFPNSWTLVIIDK